VVLYRGDDKWEAKYYRTEGMMTRLMQGGNPATVDAAGLWEVARAHVRPANRFEQRFLETTPFLSFTENRYRAERYAKRGEVVPLVLCVDQFGEDTIVFELETEGMRNAGHEGVFTLDYPCDYTRVEPLMPGDDGIAEAEAVRCEYCGVDNKHVADIRVDGQGRLLHRLLLIRVPVFLRHHLERKRYAGALRQAEWDREWLVYPVDYVHRLRGFNSRVPPATIWNAFRYKIVRNQGATAPREEGGILVPGR